MGTEYRVQFVELSPIWAWQMKNAAVAWQMPEAPSGVLVDRSYCFYLFNESSWLRYSTDQEVGGSNPPGCTIY